MKAASKNAVRTKKSAMVQMPVDLRKAIAAANGMAAKFAALSPSHQREYIQWIEEAKRPETRQKRIKSAVERLAKLGGK
jgi:uncharacterized protein YdeI (YjbR/CyaY-like superfamily)